MARHILVVDDDGDVRDVIIRALVESGFVATAATGGVAMREVLSLPTIPVDAIVLDAVLPGETSAALADHAKALKIPLVMISANPETMIFADKHRLQLLHKPFRAPALIQAIEDAFASGQYGQRHA